MTINQKAVEAVKKVLDDSEVMHCTRVWEAWRYGTMSEDDFVDASDTPELIQELIEAVTPHIREQIAQEILDKPRAYDIPMTQDPSAYTDAYNRAIEAAAQIVRGEL
jgi:Iap family predicted aminopeptidase